MKEQRIYPAPSHMKSGQLYGIGPDFHEIINTINPGEDFGCVQKRTRTVHICNRIALFINTVAANFAVQRTPAYFETPGGLVFVPLGLLKYPKN